MCRHIYDWNIVNCDVKQQIHLTSPHLTSTKRNSTKLDRKHDLNILKQVCVFWADHKNNMAAMSSDWLRHFQLLWNRLTEFHETWQEARSQCSLPKLCCLGRSKKRRWPPQSLIDWCIFDFSSQTAQWNSTKLDRKQDLNVLYQVCVFRVDQKYKTVSVADSSKRWHIVLRYIICGPLGLLFHLFICLWHKNPNPLTR